MNDKYLPPEPPAYEFTSPPPEAPLHHQQPSNCHQEYPQYVQHNVYPQQAYPPASYKPPLQSHGPLPSHNYEPHHPQPPPESTVQVRPNGCFNRARINKPQMNVLSTATLIFISGGMNIAWSVGFRSRLYNNISEHMRVAWFIGAIIGAAISGFLPKVLPKKKITMFCSMLVLFSGILHASTHDDNSALLAALYLNGIANGLVFAPTLALAGELAAFYMRGKICAVAEQLSFNIGIFLQILICVSSNSKYYSPGYNPERIRGILGAVFGFVGLCFAHMLFIESPVDMLVSDREEEAKEALRRLQRPYVVNNEIYAQLAEHKRYVAENKQLIREQAFLQAIPAFAKLSILRALNAISISSFMFYGMWLTTDEHYNYWDKKWCYLLFGACRLLGSSITSLLMDKMGRKSSSLVGLFVCGGLAFGMASQFYYPFDNSVPIMLDLFQFFAGIAFCGSSAFLAEAYPLFVKQNFISYTFIVELLVLIIIETSDIINEFFYVIGSIYSVVFILAIFCLPVTQRTTLRESQRRFRS